MESNRRKLLLRGTAAVGAVAGMGMGSTPNCSGGTGTVTQQVIDAIQAAVGTACSYVPAVSTLIGLIAMFPGLAGASTIASTLLTEVSNFLCQQFKTNGGAAAAVESAKSSKSLRATLKDGATVDLHGLAWDEANKKFVAF